MKDESRQSLLGLGMNIDQTLGRFVGNEGLLFKFLGRFKADGTFAKLSEAMEKQDTEDAFHQAHTLKGVVGNLGLGELFEAVEPVVEPLRNGELAPAQAAFPALADAYARTMAALDTISEIP